MRRTIVTPIFCLAVYDGPSDETRWMARCVQVDVRHVAAATWTIDLQSEQAHGVWDTSAEAAALALRAALPHPAPPEVHVVDRWPDWTAVVVAQAAAEEGARVAACLDTAMGVC